MRYRVDYQWREYIKDCTHIGARNRAIDLICKDLNIEKTPHVEQYFAAAMRVETVPSSYNQGERTDG